MTTAPEHGIGSSEHILGFARSLLSHRFSHNRHQPHEIYQTSTMIALIESLYDGNVPYRDVMRHGDLGVGTFNALDGEMAAVDGKFFHFRSDGSVQPVTGDELTPFAVVTRFRPNIDHRVHERLERPDCERVIHGLVPSENLFYAIRVDGHFDSLSTRTASRQTKPYPRLTDATASDPVHVHHELEGSLVGFHTPDFAQGIGVAGFHLHFLSGDHQIGGHVIDFSVDEARIRIDSESELHLGLQDTSEYRSATLTAENVSADIAQVEFSGPTGQEPH